MGWPPAHLAWCPRAPPSTPLLRGLWARASSGRAELGTAGARGGPRGRPGGEARARPGSLRDAGETGLGSGDGARARGHGSGLRPALGRPCAQAPSGQHPRLCSPPRRVPPLLSLSFPVSTALLGDALRGSWPPAPRRPGSRAGPGCWGGRSPGPPWAGTLGGGATQDGMEMAGRTGGLTGPRAHTEAQRWPGRLGHGPAEAPAGHRALAEAGLGPDAVLPGPHTPERASRQPAPHRRPDAHHTPSLPWAPPHPRRCAHSPPDTEHGPRAPGATRLGGPGCCVASLGPAGGPLL